MEKQNNLILLGEIRRVLPKNWSKTIAERSGVSPTAVKQVMYNHYHNDAVIREAIALLDEACEIAKKARKRYNIQKEDKPTINNQSNALAA